LNTAYDAQDKYFVLKTTSDCYYDDSGTTRLTLEIREHIDDSFPWVDSYKPKESEIITDGEIQIPLSA